MKAQRTFALIVSLVLLAAGSGLARGSRPMGPSAAAGVNASSAAGAPWFTIEVDTPGDTGLYTSVAYDPSLGATYISYYDAANQALRIARDDRFVNNCGPDEDWHCKTLDITDADVGKYSSIAVRPAGTGMGIAYHDATNGHLKYLWFENPNSWVHHIETIDKGASASFPTGLHTSLKYSSDGTPFIAYQFENPGGADALMLASYVGSGGNCGYDYVANQWQCDTIDVGEGVGQYASLALDGNGYKHIAYYDAYNHDLWYATSAPGSSTQPNCGPDTSWTCYQVDGSTTSDVGKHASIYVDDDNHFHIAYYDATNDDVKYAFGVDPGTGDCALGWARCAKIDDMQADYHPLDISIAEDAAGYPMIAYQSSDGDLNLARPLDALGLLPGECERVCGPENPFATWCCETIDSSGTWIPYRNGDYLSLAVNSIGLPTIAYYRLYTEHSDGNLVVAYQLGQQIFLPLVMRNQ